MIGDRSTATRGRFGRSLCCSIGIDPTIPVDWSKPTQQRRTRKSAIGVWASKALSNVAYWAHSVVGRAAAFGELPCQYSLNFIEVVRWELAHEVEDERPAEIKLTLTGNLDVFLLITDIVRQLVQFIGQWNANRACLSVYRERPDVRPSTRPIRGRPSSKSIFDLIAARTRRLASGLIVS
jgi:hypothetical protein